MPDRLVSTFSACCHFRFAQRKKARISSGRLNQRLTCINLFLFDGKSQAAKILGRCGERESTRSRRTRRRTTRSFVSGSPHSRRPASNGNVTSVSLYCPQRRPSASDRCLSCRELADAVLGEWGWGGTDAVLGTRSRRIQEGPAGGWPTRNLNLISSLVLSDLLAQATRRRLA